MLVNSTLLLIPRRDADSRAYRLPDTLIVKWVADNYRRSHQPGAIVAPPFSADELRAYEADLPLNPAVRVRQLWDRLRFEWKRRLNPLWWAFFGWWRETPPSATGRTTGYEGDEFPNVD